MYVCYNTFLNSTEIHSFVGKEKMVNVSYVSYGVDTNTQDCMAIT
jgi:hypothetical protein